MMYTQSPVVIIPAYEPPQDFIGYAGQVANIAKALIVINDGSGPEYDGIFEEIAKIENVTCIICGKNHGKGYALKKALQHCAEYYDEADICVTVDCDGQHGISDVERVAQASLDHPGALILGSRDFSLPNVPKRSKAGNTNIRRLFRLLYGISLSDTQTGLRGFSVGLARRFLDVHGDRFEYEMNMLIFSQKNGIPILEIPIRTIYPDSSEEHISHFKTFWDSLRIVGVTLRNLNYYLFSSALSGILDVFVFFILSSVVLVEVSAVNTLIATVSARVASSVLNFILNRRYVFGGKSRRSVYRYYVLWFCQLGASYGLIFLFGNVLGLPMTPMKLAGDLVLSFFSYQIQQGWVFRNKERNQFYGPLVTFARRVARIFTKKYKSIVLPPEEPTVYVCRHLNMHGPLTTVIRLDFHVHPMILSCFFDKDDCYKQYAEFTFTERRGKRKKKHDWKAYWASRIVPPVMRSLRAIPVYREMDVNSMQTMRKTLTYLKNNESVIVYPDKEYTAGYETVSELYEGFLLLGQLYKRETGRSLRFVPLYIDEAGRSIKESAPVTVDDFRTGRAEAYAYIKEAINGNEILLVPYGRQNGG